MKSNGKSKYAAGGILVVDKPGGWTSHDVVRKTKNLLGGCKVGHTGTLDPMATGVLVLLIGNATKAAPQFGHDWKTYRAEIVFGAATDTYDRTGTVTETGNPADIPAERVRAAIERFRGDTEQIPPMYSAKKVKGKRLYQYARQGKTVEREPRRVTIRDISYSLSDYPSVTLELTCSPGTYVRSLAHDIGREAGCPAHLGELRRTAAGRYTIADAAPFEDIVGSESPGDIRRHIQPLPKSPDGSTTT